MPDEIIRWNGPLDRGPFKGGNFYVSIEIKSDRIRADSAVMASVSEADEAGNRFLGDAVILVGAVVPYDGGMHVQIGTDALDPGPLQLAITLLVIHPPAAGPASG